MDIPSHTISIVISGDEMSARIREIALAEGDAPSLKAEHVERALADKGVVFGIQKQTVEKVVREVSSTGKPQRNVLVASGQPAINGGNAEIESRVGPDAVNKDPKSQFFVRAGQVLAAKQPATQGKDGANVLGEEIPAKSGKDRPMNAGENVTVSEDGTEWTAGAYGIADLSDNNITVRAPLEVSSDKMSAKMEIAPVLSDNGPLSTEEVLKTLESAGVVYGIREDAIGAALGTGQPVQTVTVAEGQPPADGEDATIEWKVGEDAETPSFVRAGQVLVTKKPATPSESGTDVLGERLPADPGRDLPVDAGKNVTVSEDRTKWMADTYGIAHRSGNSIAVEVPLQVSEDKMSAQLEIAPVLSDGRPLKLAEVLKTLEEAGVVHGIRKGTIKAALKAAQPIQTVMVAEGTPPSNGDDAALKWRVGKGAANKDPEARLFVRAGQVVVAKKPATQGEEGTTVLGERLPADPGLDRPMNAGKNVTVSEDRTEWMADVYGIADPSKDSIAVEVPIQISEDTMSAELEIAPVLSDNRPFRLAEVLRALESAGVVYGIQKKAIQAALKAGQPIQTVTVAEGTPPRSGEDSAIEWKVGRDAPNKDPRSRYFVKAGQLLAQKKPPTQDTKGTNVLGNEAPGRPGANRPFEAGENVLASKDESQFTAGAYGKAVLSRTAASVEIPLRISNDKMSVRLGVSPVLSDNSPLDLEEALGALESAGVVHGIKEDEIKDAIAKGGTVQTIVAAQGTPAEDGVDSKIEWKIGKKAANKDPEAERVVRAGQVLVTKTIAIPGKKGANVLGQEVAPRAVLDPPMNAGKNVTVSEDKTEWIADGYGIADPTHTGIAVDVPIEIGEDKMSAQLKIAPVLSDNHPLSLEEVITTLEEAGVVHGLNTANIEAALAPDQPVQSVMVAEGTPSEDGVDPPLVLKFRLHGKNPEDADAMRRESRLEEDDIVKEIVSGGDVLAAKERFQPAVEGTDIMGQALTATQPSERKISIGPGVELLADGTTYAVAEGSLGYANWVSGVLLVEDPIAVSTDKMSVHLVIHPPTTSGRILTRDEVLKRLEVLGITHGIDVEALDGALEKAARMAEPLRDIPIAKGMPPVNGQDAAFRFSFHVAPTAGKAIEGTERLDFRERAAIHNVKRGDVIAKKTLAKPGKEGFDVLGEVLPAPPGKDKVLRPGDNVTVSEDGLVFTAQAEGMVSLAGKNRIGVFSVHQITGDVDYSTGNLTMDGAITIKGWIRSGFSVRASGDILVEGGIEDAIVETGANLKVQGGIIGRDSGKIFAGGDVEARFIEGAKVTAKGNITVRQSIARSFISAEGFVEATAGRGQIMSGMVLATKGVKANVIGSDGKAKTTIDVGTPERHRKQVTAPKKQLPRLQRKRMRARAASEMTAKIGKAGTAAPGTTDRKGALAKLRREAVKKASAPSRGPQHAGQLLTETQGPPAKVEVRKMAHEGTTVTVKGRSYYVNEDMAGSGSFILNGETEMVEYR